MINDLVQRQVALLVIDVQAEYIVADGHASVEPCACDVIVLSS